jgi:glycosyltransferase involved in cell wall biosynthesis
MITAMQKKLFIIIPVYNEENSIVNVIRLIPFIPGCDPQVIVVDDGSTDNTRLLAQNEGVIVLRNPLNLGLAFAFRKGLNFCIENDADILMVLDADGQYSPEQIPSLINPLLYGEGDLIIGNRFLKGSEYKEGWIKYLINFMLSFLISRILLRLRSVYDIQSSFRAFNQDLGKFLLSNLKGTYNYAQELFILSSLSGFQIRQIPIKCQKRKCGKSRLIKNPFIHIYRILKTSIKVYLKHANLKNV